MRYLFLLILPLLTSGCLKITNIKDDPQSEMNALSEPGQYIVSDAAPNSYKVRIPLSEGVHLLRRASVDDLDSFQYIQPQIQDGYFIDSTVVPGTTYIYEAGYYQDKDFHLSRQHRVSVPIDLEIRGKVLLTEKTTWIFSRIYFQKNSRLITQGNPLTLIAREIISEEGSLETFESQGASPGKGRSGSLISIQTENARGYLKLIFRGENGALGAQGKPGRCFHGVALSTPEKGQIGQDGGNSGYLKMNIKRIHQLQWDVVAQAGFGGAGGKEGSLCGSTLLNSQTSPAGRDGIKQTSCITDFQGEHCY